jgi:stage II sporulation protein D
MCLAGILIIVVFLSVRVICALFPEGTGDEPADDKSSPVVQSFSNLWIMGADEYGITVFQDEEIKHLPFDEDIYNADNIYSSINYIVNIEIPDDETINEVLKDRMADVELTDEKITRIDVKTEKINGKVMGVELKNEASASGITNITVEIEGYGILSVSEDYKGYQIYGSPRMCSLDELAFGYDFTDFILDNGEICGFFVAREEAMEDIRVLIKSSDYSGIYHDSVVMTSKSELVAKAGNGEDAFEVTFEAGEEITIDRDSELLKHGRVTIYSPGVTQNGVTLKSVERSQGTPVYRGNIELINDEEGIVVVNELPLEEYLYSVVPSEMPASYPDEALRAQAICARTYAYIHMEHAAYPQYGAHLDDSTTYQVYNNIAEREKSTLAVKETYGQLLYTPDGEPAETYYYSTSCGMGTDANIWKTKEAPTLTYLKSKALSRTAVKSGQELGEKTNLYMEQDESAEENIAEILQENDAFEEYITSTDRDDYEYSEGWYRWTYNVKKLDVEYMREIVKKRHDVNKKLVLVLDDETGEFSEGEIENFESISNMFVAKRGVGGVCDELVIVTDKGTYMIITEHNIRYVLDDGETKVVRQDGSKVEMPTLLPSAFFALSVVRNDGNVVGYTLVGGGFGHGVGMSQNGAKDMAEEGLSAYDILSFFFDGCSIRSVY